MVIVLTVLHVLIACFLVLIVLIQSGKGADIGAAFGGGASQTMFGARGATTVLHKITSGLAAAFMLTSLGLAVLAGGPSGRSVIRDEPAKPSAPASQPGAGPVGESKAPPAPAAPPGEPAKAGEPTKR
jgi:preprotein translocase subunit SecG